MRKIIVLCFVTMDGVMQAPGGRKEDQEAGFKYGGWTAPFHDRTKVYEKVLMKEMKPADLLLGGRTFRVWENYWPEHADFWPRINNVKKYALSRKMKKSNWKNSFFLRNVADIKKLKRSKGSAIKVWGSSQLVHLLMKHDLVDEFWLKIFPVVLGKGKKLFHDDAVPAAFKVTGSVVTSNGIILVKYQRAGKVRTGTVGA